MLRFGIIGISEGNGHPYSWSAIINGYNIEAMNDCPYAAIPRYLAEHKFPEESLSHLAKVTHIWTQDIEQTMRIAEASNIPNIASAPEDMIGNVDAVLIARDDAENHFEQSLPFMAAGIPVFIDKPFALDEQTANNILSFSAEDWKVFSCSSIRFAKEVYLTAEEAEQIGQIRFIEAITPKNWNKYGVHLLEPIIFGNQSRGKLTNVIGSLNVESGIFQVEIFWDKLQATLKCYGKYDVGFIFRYFGEHGWIEKRLQDTFGCFKASLLEFIKTINQKSNSVPRTETLEIVKILELGNKFCERY